jgi:hypothetical protein
VFIWLRWNLVDEASRSRHQVRKPGNAMLRIRVILDRDLTIRSVDGGCREARGKSALEFVPRSHHDFLTTLCARLFDRHRMISCDLPLLNAGRHRPRCWSIRAAPICEAGRAVGAVAHAVPRDGIAPADWPPVNLAAWERELAVRELMPILSAFDAELVSAVGPPPWASGPDSEASRRGSSRPRLQPGRVRSTAQSGRARQTK